MKLYLYLILSLASTVILSQYQGPIPAISTGYGSEGSNNVSVSNIRNDNFLLKDISVFYPSGTTTPLPTIFFSHGFGGNDTTNYIETIRNISSNGYAVVFVPYKTLATTIEERYLTLYDGFIKAARNLETIIDTTRAGFYGHSFGGGATVSVSNKLFTENKWGTNGKFIYCSAPWYTFELENANLNDFPTDCNMLTVLFNDDDVNDHRMGMDIFNNIPISTEQKDCIMVFDTIISDYSYEASHSLPAQYSSDGSYNALDYHVTFRLLSALADYTFTGNIEAKNIALGNGASTQIEMGNQLPNLIVTDSPTPRHTEATYQFPCSDDQNDRQEFCQKIVGINETSIINKKIILYPNPTNGQLILDLDLGHEKLHVSIYSLTGERMLSIDHTTNIDLSDFPNGTYFIYITGDDFFSVEKIIKEE